MIIEPRMISILDVMVKLLRGRFEELGFVLIYTQCWRKDQVEFWFFDEVAEVFIPDPDEGFVRSVVRYSDPDFFVKVEELLNG